MSMRSADARVPKHYVVKERIAELIAQAAPGSPLPTERELATRFQTSRTTVRQALTALSLDGVLERTQGRGTFVAEPKRVLVRQLTSYSDDLRDQGHDPSSTLLDVRRVRADASVAAHLGLAEGAYVHRVERLRGVGGEPLAHETAYLVGDLPRLRRELEAYGSLYQTLEQVYGVRLARVEDLVQTAPATPQDARLLDVGIGVPMLLIERTGWGTDDRPVEWTRSVFRGDRFSFIAHTLVPPAGVREEAVSS